ncbi:MAG TPA: SLC13 family permease [Rhodanobacteraceae bacterium]|jgi:di/tricarboxylate transporter|nr:SLC13 family permease [Rhodanobacteraceae bacterium]
MTANAWITLGIVIGAIALFASEKVRVDLVALIVLALLAGLRIVTPDEALAGFSNEATVTVAAMFALSLGIERSGALEPLVAALTRIRQPWLLTLALMLTIAPMGAFVKNIALVATFLPLALRVCARSRTSPARVLMPMSFAAQMGGVCTLIGTSSNLLADSLAQKHGLPAFGVFEFTKMGALLAVAGIAYLMLIGRWLLPKEIDADAPAETEIGKYVTELKVTPESPLLGKTIADIKLGEKHGVYPLELLRGDRHVWSPRSQQIEAGDVLLVRGAWEKIEDLRKRAELEIDPENRYGPDHGQARVLVEAMVKPQSMVVGNTLGELQLQRNFDAIALAIHRRGRVLREKLRDVRLDGGDVLMLLVGGDGADTLRADEHFVVLSEREDTRRFSRRAIAAMAIMAAVVTVSGLHWLPIPIAAVAGAVAMAIFGCFGRKDIYEGIDWKIIVLLAAILPLGTAIENSGLSQRLVDAGLGLVGAHGPLAALLMTYLLTALLTELMGHNPAVVLMVGIAIGIAHTMHADPRPFVIAVAFAAATSFATPVGYPTNTMVYYAGGYKFTDFMKMGIPLIALFCALSMLLIPYFWPLQP